MATDLLVPRVNTNDDEVEVVHWYVNDRELVKKGADIADIASSKATFVVQAECDGYIKHCCHRGQVVRVGNPIARVYASHEEMDLEFVAATPLEEKRDPMISQPPETPALSIEPHPDAAPLFGVTRFSKAALRFLEENGRDPKEWTGRGLVTRKDLEAVKNAVPSELGRGLRSEKVPRAKQAEIDSLTLGREGGITSSLTVEFLAEPILRTLKEQKTLNAQLLPLLVFELAKLLETHPSFTAFFEKGRIYFYDRIDLGIAIDFGKGLKVVVLREANRMTPIRIYEAILDFTVRYMKNEISVAELTDSTFTVTDLSSQNIRHFQPLLNGRQSAILGIGGDSLHPGHPLSLTLAFDHRVLTGRDAAGFLTELKKNTLKHADTVLKT